MEHIIIIGNGISGITAARNIRKLSEKKITVISSESDYFFSRTALMYVFMGHMKFEHTKPYEDWFWKKNQIDLIKGHVERLDEAYNLVCLNDGEEINYDSLIIATGSKSRMPGWKGQELNGVHGLYSLQDLESIERSSQGISRAVIIGGGLIGVELAEMLHSRGIQVTMIIMESGYWRNVLPKEESELIGDHLEKHGIEIHYNSEIKEITGDNSGRVTAIVTKDGKKIECQFVGITIGVEPNVDFLRSTSLEINKGILVDGCMRTSIENIFAIGDCSEQRNPKPGRRSIEAVWYTGRIMGEVVAETICGNPREYDPGVWFNSAKFFDIEYQTYGVVPSDLPENQRSYCWQHESENKLLRMVFEKNSFKMLGINALGIRLRHEVCDRWIREGITVFKALESFGDVNFDPEFHNKNEQLIIEHFNSLKLGNQLMVPKSKSFFKK